MNTRPGYGTSPDRDREIADRCRTLANAQTVVATTSFRATLKASSAPASHLDDPPDSLPHISLAPEGEEALPSAARWPVAKGPDLEIVGVIGQGGMGRVLAARQRSLRREVALKTLRPDAASSGATVALLREGVVTGALEHPNIVPIHAVGCDDRGRPLLVMKRIEGVAWSELLRDPAHVAWKTLDAEDDRRLEAHLEILANVCNALHFAHQRGIVHRDLKPDNVMVGSFGEIYLVDWGIAVRTGVASEAVVGTPSYLAPEMVLGEPVDARTDVYLLGATLHEVLTGSPRHDGRTFEAIFLQAAGSVPHAYEASIPEELAALCNRATHVDPMQRPESALAFRKALAEHLRHRGSISLTTAAEATLTSARTMRKDGDSSARQRLLTEAHFGFRQALHEWPENSAARRGLTTCLEEMIDLELSQGDIAGARALLDEMPQAHPKLAAEIAAHEEKLAHEQRHDQRLRAMEQELDPNVGRRTRLLSTGIAAVIYLALSLYAILVVKTFRPVDLLYFSFAVLGVLIAIIAIANKRVLRNAYNRRMVAIAVIAVCAMIADRIVGVVRDVPVEVTVAHDMITFTIVCIVGALSFGRWLGWIGLLYAISAVVTLTVPGSGAIMFTLAACLTAIFVGIAWRKSPSKE